MEELTSVHSRTKEQDLKESKEKRLKSTGQESRKWQAGKQGSTK